jgi:hypothetical protein
MERGESDSAPYLEVLYADERIDMRRRTTLATVGALAAAAVFSLSGVLPAHASSHREAPLISQDPTADSTDLYAFISKADNGTKVLNIIANYIPFEDPAGGPNYYAFSDDVRYEINIENDATMQGGSPAFTGRPNISYQFNFTTHYKNPGTFLTYGVGTEVGAIKTVGDNRQNLTQTYTVTQVNNTAGAHGLGSTTDLTGGQTLMVPPNNIGHATPLYDQNADPTKPAVQGATATSQLDPYTSSTIYTLSNGIKVFAGQRYDGFYADIGALFDLLSVRNPGKNSIAGYNVHTIAMQIPVSLVATGAVPIVGIYTSASRRAVTVRPSSDNGNGSLAAPSTNLPLAPGLTGCSAPGPVPGSTQCAAPVTSNQLPGTLNNFSGGPYVQVSRLGNPLFNEVMTGVGQKDEWNESPPSGDAEYAKITDCPQLAGVFNIVLGTKLPACGYSLLDAIFQPDLLKVDTSTDPVPLEMNSKFNRLSVFGGDTVFSPFQKTNIPSGWPNGRRMGDDVVDIAATAIASGPTLSTITPVGDNVNSNGLPFNQVFPFMQTPANGYIHDHVYP